MNKERFIHCIDLVEQEQQVALDMANWLYQGSLCYSRVEDIKDPNTCATAACWAGLIQLREAKTPEEKEMNASMFALRYLELSDEEDRSLIYSYLFITSTIYGAEEMGAVTREALVANMRKLAEEDDIMAALADYGEHHRWGDNESYIDYSLRKG